MQSSWGSSTFVPFLVFSDIARILVVSFLQMFGDQAPLMSSRHRKLLAAKSASWRRARVMSLKSKDKPCNTYMFVDVIDYCTLQKSRTSD